MATTANQVLQAHAPQVKHLLRRYHVAGPVDMNTIEKGYNKHGETFMMKLLEVIVPDTNSFTGLIQPLEANLTPVLDTKTLATSPEMAAAMVEAQQPGKVWSFWDNLLNGITKTGETIADFKTSLATNPQSTPGTYKAEQSGIATGKTLYLVAGAIILFIVLTLLFFRK